jgi:hypothetical protein
MMEATVGIRLSSSGQSEFGQLRANGNTRIIDANRGEMQS